jgi:hypothetical protein
MDKIIELLGKVFGLLGKLIEALFSSKTFWLIVIAFAIFSVVVAQFLWESISQGGKFLWLTQPQWLVIAIASIALILAKVIIWVVGLLLEQFT